MKQIIRLTSKRPIPTVKRQVALARIPVETQIKDGKAERIEIVVTKGDKFPERVREFLQGLSRMSLNGSSREVRIVDGYGDKIRIDGDYADIKLFVDGDGNEKILEVK